jgi:hypothetical protein
MQSVRVDHSLQERKRSSENGPVGGQSHCGDGEMEQRGERVGFYYDAKTCQINTGSARLASA